jgi:hypothetical protein
MERMDGRVHPILRGHLRVRIFQRFLPLAVPLAVAVGDLRTGHGGGGDAAPDGVAVCRWYLVE